MITIGRLTAAKAAWVDVRMDGRVPAAGGSPAES
jgi:hypothetical protein